MSKKQLIEVFYGDRLAHESERRAINTLRAELERRQVSARLLVNFTVSHGARQIDVVIVTAQRCMIVELKSHDMSLPIVGRENGPWQQVQSDGSQRPMEKNYYTQARDQTYGLNDAMKELADTGRVPHPTRGRFFHHIDTVVCLAPGIPIGSQFEPYRFVDVVGLDTLVTRLIDPGRGLPNWTTADWDELMRHLGLYPEADDEPAERQRRADDVAVEDYRRRFRGAMSADLVQLVPAAARIDNREVTADAETVAAVVTRPNERVLLLGASGDGKTHLSKHTAVRLTGEGQMVVWLPADDYEKGRLGRSLARAVGPYSTEGAWALLRKAADSGVGITVLIDALETCSDRDDLLGQLNALLLQIPASVLVTASRDDHTELLSPTTRIELAPPSAEERTRLATSYGSTSGVAESEEFRTRFDVSVAAQLITELPAEASNTDVLDSYISQLTPSETVRAGLRCLAAKMDTELRTVIPANEALSTLRRYPPLAATPSAIDDILTSRLVSLHQGRLRFGHERLARFLAAEHLVLASPDGFDLGRVLSEPGHRDLREHAIMLEHDPARRYEAIRQIGDAAVVTDAARGKFGSATARQAIADVTELLVQAAAVTRAATLQAPDDPELATAAGRWQCARKWSPIEQALLSAAGQCVQDGVFLHEVGALLDATDDAMEAAVTTLRDEGYTTPRSAVLASTYGVFSSGGDTLAATIVVDAALSSRDWARTESTAAPTASMMWQPNPRSWGRLYLAAVLSQPVQHREDARNLTDLVRTGWAKGGGSLWLELLNAAQTGCGSLDPADRQRMIEVLNGLHADNIWVSSMLIEVLATYGQITPMNTLDDIGREIADALDDESDPAHREAAATIVARMFEDQRVLGPYSEAVDALSDPMRLALYAMAVQGRATIGYDWAMKRLADGVERADDAIGQALAEAARTVTEHNMIRQEIVAGHIHALQGWAKVSDTLSPPPAVTKDPADALFGAAWRCFDELLFDLFRGAEPTTDRSASTWVLLLSELAEPATAVMCEMQRSVFKGYNTDDAVLPHDRLVNAYPDQIRQLLEWALTHRDHFDPKVWGWRVHNLQEYIVRTLGAVGTATTADMLRHYVHDAELGGAAVAAIRAIETRSVA